MFQDKDSAAPSKSKAMSRLTSGSSPSIQSKRAKGPASSRPPPPSKSKPEDQSIVPFDREDIIGTGEGPIHARKTVHRVEKSGRNPLSAVSGPTVGQRKPATEEKRKGPQGEGNLIPMRVKSYRQSSGSSFDSSGGNIGYAYSQCMPFDAGDAPPDLAKLGRGMVESVPKAERLRLAGLESGNLDKLQACLAEVCSYFFSLAFCHVLC